MSQVGWMPLAPATPANPTIAVDNGDGTGTITNPDGSTVPVCTDCTDLTNTLSQDADGNIVVTPSDGSAPYTLPIVHTEDTDTILGPYVVNETTGIGTAPVLDVDGNPTGDTVTSDFSGLISTPAAPDTDTRLELIVAADGSVSQQVIDVSTGNPIGSATPLTTPHIELESYKQNAPNTTAEVAAGAGKAVDFGSTEFLTTNGAAESGANGVRNPSGGLGFHSDQIANIGASGATFGPRGYNGGTVILKIGNNQGYVNATLEAPDRDGQILIIHTNGTGTDDGVDITPSGCQMAGPRRRSDNNELIGGDPGYAGINPFRMREHESMILRGWAQTAVWEVISFTALKVSGSNYEENDSGFVTGWGNLPYNAAAFPAFATPFTTIVEGTNGTFTAHGARY